MSDFVNIFVSGTDESGKDLTVQGLFKKSLVYIDGVCYTKLEAENEAVQKAWKRYRYAEGKSIGSMYHTDLDDAFNALDALLTREGE